MYKSTRKFIKECVKIRLTKDERLRVYNELLLYTERHPLAYKPSWSDLLKFVFKKRRFAFITFCVVIVIITSAGVSLAGERSLPGDFLYPVKTRVNEEIKALVSRTSKTKTEWEIARINKRLTEVETLTRKDKLNLKTVKVAEQEIAESVHTVTQLTEKLKTQEQKEAVLETSAALEASLQSHGKIIKDLKEENKDTLLAPVPIALEKIEEQTKETQEYAAKERLKAEEKVLTVSDNDEFAPKINSKVKKAVKRLKNIKEKVQKIKTKLPRDNRLRKIEERINIIEDIISQSKILQKNNEFKSSFETIQKAENEISGLTPFLDAIRELPPLPQKEKDQRRRDKKDKEEIDTTIRDYENASSSSKIILPEKKEKKGSKRVPQ